MPDWKETLNLPRTGFRMKAGLPATEPDAIARWEEMDLYGRIRERRRGAPRYVLHDGPPYANGEIHVGTALNKILKDFIVRARTMAGCDAPYVPGWDCHGLPIELRVDRELGKRKREMSVADVRRECRRYAERYVDIQRAGFKRLGVLGDWSAPYLTMRYAYQATIVRALGRFVEQGLVYRGKKPVHWCIRVPHRAGRGRGRVRAAPVAVDLRRVPARRREPSRRSARWRRPWRTAPRGC